MAQLVELDIFFEAFERGMAGELLEPGDVHPLRDTARDRSPAQAMSGKGGAIEPGSTGPLLDNQCDRVGLDRVGTNPERIGLGARVRARKRVFQALADGMTDAAREALENLLMFDPVAASSRRAVRVAAGDVALCPGPFVSHEPGDASVAKFVDLRFGRVSLAHLPDEKRELGKKEFGQEDLGPRTPRTTASAISARPLIRPG